MTKYLHINRTEQGRTIQKMTRKMTAANWYFDLEVRSSGTLLRNMEQIMRSKSTNRTKVTENKVQANKRHFIITKPVSLLDFTSDIIVPSNWCKVMHGTHWWKFSTKLHSVRQFLNDNSSKWVADVFTETEVLAYAARNLFST